MAEVKLTGIDHPAFAGTEARATFSIEFTASGPNAAGVVTELLVQPLRSRLRTPVRDRYRGAGFVAFAAGSLTAEIPCKRGAVAVGVRFVRADTGQETGVVELGILEVE